jgi:hypothetical protein
MLAVTGARLEYIEGKPDGPIFITGWYLSTAVTWGEDEDKIITTEYILIS